MLFLLIEDDDDKRAAVSAFLNASFPGCAMREARSFHSGLQELLLGQADVVILDMTIPTFDIGDGEDGGRPQAYAGRELMWHMRRDGIPTRVIVLTAFDRFGDGHEAQTLAELDKELGTSFGQQYLGAIQFNPTLDAWKRELKQLIQAVGEMKSA